MASLASFRDFELRRLSPKRFDGFAVCASVMKTILSAGAGAFYDLRLAVSPRYRVLSQALVRRRGLGKSRRIYDLMANSAPGVFVPVCPALGDLASRSASNGDSGVASKAKDSGVSEHGEVRYFMGGERRSFVLGLVAESLPVSCSS